MVAVAMDASMDWMTGASSRSPRNGGSESGGRSPRGGALASYGGESSQYRSVPAEPLSTFSFAQQKPGQMADDFDTEPSFNKLQAMLSSDMLGAGGLGQNSNRRRDFDEKSISSAVSGPSHYRELVLDDSVPPLLQRALNDLQKQIHNVSRDSQAVARDSSSFEQRIKDFVRTIFEKLDRSIAEVKQDQQSFGRRSLGDADENEVRGLKMEMQTYKQQVPQIKEYMESAAEEMKNGWDQMLEHHRKVKLCLERESRERLQAHDDLENHLLALLSKERNDRDMHMSKVHAHLASLSQDLEASREAMMELPVLRKRVLQLEEKAAAQPQMVVEEIEARLLNPIERLKDLERHFDHMQACLTQESAARHSMAEAFEGMMKSERSKLTNLITQKAANARNDLEDLEKLLVERIDKEHAEREAHLEDFHQLYARHKAAVHDRTSTAENDIRAQEQKFAQLLKEVRDLETQHRRLEDCSTNAIRDTKREVMLALKDEAANREEAVRSIDEQLVWLGEHHDRMRELAVQRGPRKMLGLGGGKPGSTSPRHADSMPSSWAITDN